MDGIGDRVPTLVLFPGLGMDGRVFRPQQDLVVNPPTTSPLPTPALGGGSPPSSPLSSPPATPLPPPLASRRVPVVVPPWLEPEWGETLEHYSARMAERVPRGVRPLYLGGVSIGGAVALEVARHVAADGVILIASATTSRAIPNLLRHLAKLAPWIPTGVIRPFVWRLSPLVVRAIMLGERPGAGLLLAEAIRNLDLGLWKWGASAIMDWELRGEVGCPVWSVHGDADPITPVYRVRADRVVKGGGHMLNVTHPGEVNGFLREVMDGGGGRKALRQKGTEARRHGGTEG